MRIDGNFSYPPWLFHGGILIPIVCYEDYEENEGFCVFLYSLFIYLFFKTNLK